MIRKSDVSRETYSIIDTCFTSHKPVFDLYVERLLWWNRKINLVSRDTTIKESLLHVRHSLYINTKIPDSTVQIVDAGSGGGLPGIPLAILNPHLNVVLVDVVEKKMMAADAIKRELGLKNVQCVHASIEDYEAAPNSVLVSKHAFKLPELITMTHKKGYLSIILLKGNDFQDELKHLQLEVDIEAERIDAVEKSSFFTGKTLLKIQPH
jgi:16S rRNA (guanine527-N7)-methyltransferase